MLIIKSEINPKKVQMQGIHSTVHNFLNEIMGVSSREELDEIASRYKQQLGEADGDGTMLWEDILTLGKELIYLKTGSDDETGRGLMATLSEQEVIELREADRILDNNLFSYHYQPIVSVATGDIYSYEALMRPQSDILKSPLGVIKYAELKNRLNDIQKATFLNVLGVIDADPSFFHKKMLFINSIPKTVLIGDDRLRVDDLLLKHNGSIVVEITEQAELKGEEFQSFKNRLERLNVQTAIDDYGTGYSNVRNLLRYMPDYVKIDRSLLTGISDDPKKRHFVREIIEFCHSNGILALAEGVETSDELRAVILLGADLIQGFYTARPAAEPLESIPYDIRQEMKNYLHERQEGMASQVYDPDSGEHMDLSRLVENNTSCILIGRDGDYSVSGNPKLDAEVLIEIADDVKVDLMLENVRLTNKKKLPCIEIGKNSEVTLFLKGDNRLNMGGIRVPEGSTFTLAGDGELHITLDGEEYFGIGNGITAYHGRLIFNHEGVLNIVTSGTIGVCIGSGYGGEINISSGQFALEMNGDRALGIGVLYNDCNLDITNADINIELNTIKGVAIGSTSANDKLTISNSSVKLYMSGKEAVGLGSVTGENSEVYVHDASVVMNAHNDRCSGTGALDGKTSFKIERASMRIYAKGEKVLPFGGFSGDTDLSFVDSDTTVKIMTDMKLREYLPPDRIDIVHGRARVVLNGFEYELKD
ncbi:MAG: EAL domain-containing protein [Lachnospiraceae bacterium]|nr:EAL domain-containing protein [Lachnospiraceae bacterium]